MCGIAGMIGAVDERSLRVMTQMLRHRGPDGGAIWLGDDVGFGHRRLKIIDTSDRARQPMLSEDGRFALTFNGEIFNYRELRAELQGHGHRFRSDGDGEVLLYACMQWGERVAEHLVGQFAFAFHNARDGSTLLARDHLGVKPLYLAEANGVLYFASEAKALVSVLPSSRAVDWDALPGHVAFLWTSGEHTLFKGIQRLEPGTQLLRRGGRSTIWRYWDLIEKWKAARESPLPAERRDEMLAVVLDEALRSQLVSDVPLGLLLSGGLDSTILLALMAKAGQAPEALTATYSASSRSRDVFEDDLPYAERAADTFGARLRRIELRDEADDIIRLLPDVLWHLDEPLADPTVVTNYALAAAAKPTHTVLLSGMGADELFAGYPRYPAALLGERLRALPGALFPAAAGTFRALVRSGLLPLTRTRRAMQFLSHAGKPFEERFIGYSSYFSSEELSGLFSPDLFSGNAVASAFTRHRSVLRETTGLSPLSRMLATDAVTFLPRLNLENMDKTSMAHGVEMRVPFLDHRMVEFCMTLPDADKLGSRAERKVALRRAFAPMLPADIVRRPKTGYSPPVRGWMRDSLRQYTEDTLLSPGAHTAGLLRQDAVRRMLTENTAGHRDWALQLWMLLTMEIWLEVLADNTWWSAADDTETLPRIEKRVENGTHDETDRC